MEYVEIESLPERRHILKSKLKGKDKNGSSQAITVCGVPFAIDGSIIFANRSSGSMDPDHPPAPVCKACEGDDEDAPIAAAPRAAQPVTDIPHGDIEPDPDQPRKYFDQAKLEEMAASMKVHGVLSPLEVRPNPKKPGKFLITFGERRWRAAELAGLATVPCMVVAELPGGGVLKDGNVLERQLIENGQREDISPLEQGAAYAQLRAMGMPLEDLMQRTGKSRTHIYARMKLTELVAPAKKALAEGKLQPAIAELATTIGDPKLQEQFVRDVLAEKRDLDPDDHGVLYEAIADDTGKEINQPLSFRAAKALLRRRYSTRLALAKFDTTDADLVPAAGACGGCPFRSGNQPELPGMSNGKPADDVCTNTACFETKTKAAWKRTASDAKSRGLDVLTYDDAKKDRVFDSLGLEVRESSPYVDPDKPLPYDLQKSPGKPETWKKLLGKKAAEIPRAIVQDASGAARELLDYNAAVAALQEAGKIDKPKKPAPASKPAKKSSQPLNTAEERDADRDKKIAFLKRLEREVIAAAQKGVPAKKELAWWRWVVECIASSMLASDSVLVDLVDKKKPWPAQLAEKATNVNKARALITGTLFSAITEMAAYHDDNDKEILAVATLFGIDSKKIATEVAAAAKAEGTAKKAKKGSKK